MIAVLIFVIAIVIYYQYTSSLSDETGQVEETMLDAKAISAALVSKGYPADWNTTTVQRIGITNGNYRINSTKLAMFESMNYSKQKELFKTYYDYYFYLQAKNSSKSFEIGNLSNSSKTVVRITRFVIHDSEIKKMVLILWG